jgi:hypothetical protein
MCRLPFSGRMFSGVDYIQPNERGIIVIKSYILFRIGTMGFCAIFTPFLLLL